MWCAFRATAKYNPSNQSLVGQAGEGVKFANVQVFGRLDDDSSPGRQQHASENLHRS